MSGGGPRLEVADLDASYGAARVLFGVSLRVERGEAVALLGRNGAGKSTTLKAVMGLVRAEGRVRFEGADVSRLPPHRIARLGLGYVPEDRRILTTLTVAENLEVARQAARPGLPAWTPARLFALFPNLAGMSGRAAGRMSGGEQQMLAIARTLMGNPSLLLLDEPSAGLAPILLGRIADAVRALVREGLSVLLAEQNVRFAGAIADRVYVIEKGRVCFEGPMAALERDEDVRRRYLAV